MLCSEQGLDREMVIEAMKDAVKAAARKQFKAQDKTGDSIQVDWNSEDGEVEVSVQKTVVAEVENSSAELSLDDAREMAGDEVELGDMLLIPLNREEMGRIAAQTAKQILVQKVREAIREKVYDEYIDRKGELINGTVKRFERGDIIVDLGNNLEGVISRREQSRGEVWNQGERIRVVIVDVTKDQKGQQIKLSRASADLVKRLFEMEVPEIYDETVVIKSAVREPGDRAKIAVSSNERDVDPVGACVGMKGSRVQSIIKELRGEKIDIIEWSDEPSVFAANALSPAKVSQVRITDIEKRKMHVIVGEDQLSLAIGKKGQNVRLATRLVGWDIDIVSEEVLKKEIAQQMGKMMASGQAVPLTALGVVNTNQADLLAEKGIDGVEKLAETSIDDLVEALDLTFDEASQMIASAREVVAAKEVTPEHDIAEVADNASDESESSVETVEVQDGAVEEVTNVTPNGDVEATEEVDEGAAADGEESDSSGVPEETYASASEEIEADIESEPALEEVTADEPPTSDDFDAGEGTEESEADASEEARL